MKIALIFFLLGLICGAFYGIIKFIILLLKNKVIYQIIGDLIFSSILGIILINATIKYLCGEIRGYICAIFVLSLLISFAVLLAIQSDLFAKYQKLKTFFQIGKH